MTIFTAQQKTALRYPCYFAVETAHPRYARWAAPGVSIVLTINTGYE